MGITILPLIGFAGAVSSVLVESERTRLLASVERRAALAASDIDRVLRTQIALLTTLAGSHALDGPDLPAFYVEAGRALASQPDWFTIILSDPADGRQVLNLLRPLGTVLPRFPDMASHDAVVRTRTPMIVARPTARGPVSDRPVFGIRAPVVRDDQVRFVLTTALDPAVVGRVLTALALPADWGGAIVDDKGVVLACTDCTVMPVGRIVPEDLWGRLAADRPGAVVFDGSPGPPSYVAGGRAPLSGWAVTITVPQAAIDRLWRDDLWIVGLAGVVSAAAALVALGWTVHRRRRTARALEAQVRDRTAALEALVTERNLLLREINHRVMNNLQIVDGLIGLQSGHSDDAATQAILEDLRRRVNAIGLVHRQLLRADRFDAIDLARFLADLCANLRLSFGADRTGVDIVVSAESRVVGLETAAPIGLIVSELVTNSIKHAFTDGTGGLIRVEVVEPGPSRMEIRVVDDGRRSAPATDARSDGMGATIVRALVAQIDGEMHERTGKGTESVVLVPLRNANGPAVARRAVANVAAQAQ